MSWRDDQLDAVHVLTVWTVADEATPSALRHLYDTNLHLDLADGVITLFGVNLALQGLECELLFSVLVHELIEALAVATRGSKREDWRQLTLRGSKMTLTCAGSAPLSNTESVSFSSVS